MIRREFADETLMAFADGELDDATAAAIEKAMQPDIASRVALFLETRIQVKEALMPVLDEPVPDRLSQSVQRMIDEAERRSVPSHASEGARVVAFRARDNQAMRRPQASWIMPLAASLVAVVLGSADIFLGLPAKTSRMDLRWQGRTALFQRRSGRWRPAKKPCWQAPPTGSVPLPRFAMEPVPCAANSKSILPTARPSYPWRATRIMVGR
ncbi:hypothetical protein [Mesorhizobium sp.]|uniref:anti-sigma factor family protein n=1 Tax=Mesorhizobium sp. TaxID=1871066 RepID=UPI00338FBCBF